MDNQQSYFRYWGKAKPESGERPRFHLLVFHSLDVASVASVWWDHSKAIQSSFLRQASDLSHDQIKAWALFFVSIHDYGKFDIRFQQKAHSVWKQLQGDFYRGSEIMPTVETCKTYDHGRAGLYWYDRDRGLEVEASGLDLIMDIADGRDNTADDVDLAWVKAVVGHHGFVYPANSSVPDLPLHSSVASAVANRDKVARQEWIKVLEEIYLEPVGLSADDSPPQPSPLLAGFCSVSDWLGSRSDEKNFRYRTEPTDVNGLKAYFYKKCRQDALRVLKLSGICGQAKPYQGVKALLEHKDQPRQIQTLVDDLPTKPGITIVEAPTGSGKTEMALAYAWRLLENNLADSIVFAMPTQATANAMLERLEGLATTLFHDSPNLILAHGNARFNKDFLALKQLDDTVQKREEAWAQCNEWLGQSRKRIFLGQIGICTIDQVLVSVLPVRHRFIRGFGVARSVLIVDEIHAYDAYMYGLLEAVLREQQAAGGSSILLSATLPQALKNTLLATTGSHFKKSTKPDPYPHVSCSDGRQVKTFTLPKDRMPPNRQVSFELIEHEDLLPDITLCEHIVSAAEVGAQVAIICNLVDAAQQLSRQLQAMVDEKGLDIGIDVFHARYCLTHRQGKEDAILKHYGKGGERRKGRILVSTQVIEQSLDVDFDWLVTQLCPVDLLFQRMGRLHRHEWKRPAGFEDPLCTVLLPPGTDYGVHGLIYANTRVMWRTAQKLRDCIEQVIEFPKAYREWIESIYQHDAWGNEPQEIDTSFERFEDEVGNKRLSARQMLKWAEDVALNDSHEKIRAVTRDSEFNLSVVPYLETVQGRQLLNGTTFELLDEWQQAEALSMNSVGVPNSWGNGWKKFLPEQNEDDYIWLSMKQNGEIWCVTCNGVDLSYHPEWGMEKSV